MRGFAGLYAVIKLSAIIASAVTAAKRSAALAIPVKAEQHPAETDAFDVHSLARAIYRAGIRTARVLTSQDKLRGATFRERSGNRIPAKKEKVQKINAIGEINRTADRRVSIHIRRFNAGQGSAPDEEVVENVHRVGEIDFKIQVGIAP